MAGEWWGIESSELCCRDIRVDFNRGVKNSFRGVESWLMI